MARKNSWFVSKCLRLFGYSASFYIGYGSISIYWAKWNGEYDELLGTMWANLNRFKEAYLWHRFVEQE